MKGLRMRLLIIAVFLIGCGTFLVNILLEDDLIPPKLPTGSNPKELTLTSNGCCFLIKEVEVYLQDGEGNRRVMTNIDKIRQYDIINEKLPDSQNGPGEVVLCFKVFYGDEYEFSTSILEYESYSELKNKGLLLYFQESDGMYIHIISGDKRTAFKLGYDDNRWDIIQEPNAVYE